MCLDGELACLQIVVASCSGCLKFGGSLLSCRSPSLSCWMKMTDERKRTRERGRERVCVCMCVCKESALSVVVGLGSAMLAQAPAVVVPANRCLCLAKVREVGV